MAVRNNPDFRKLKTALARDPEGTSRIPQETFQQVVDRMEQGTTTKTIDWPWIVEFFTKRGRPLTREEIKRLQDEDKRIHEEENERKRQLEEAEKRRMARLMEEIEGENSDEQIDHEKRLDESRKKQRQLEEDESEMNQDLDERSDDEQVSDENDDEDLERGNSDDELAAHKSLKRNKSQRARRNNDENLRGQSLTANDYVRQSSADPGKKKGKYGITVPTPFKFDTREAVKPKTIRERKVEEMVMEKQLEEKGALTNQFRCKPIPAAVLVPRYQQILDKNEERRLKVKQESIEITKQREAPFSFWERDKHKMEKKRNPDPDEGLDIECRRPQFRANKIPVACTIPMYESKMKKEEEERAKRINSMAKIKQASARMPSRMQQDADNKKQNPKEVKREEYSFKPQINEPKTGAMFKRMQDKFLEKLNKRKGEYMPVQPQSPNFTKTKSKPLQREYLNEGIAGSASVPEDKFKAALAKQMSMAKSLQSVKPPSSTKAVELAQKRRREDMESKKAQEEQNAKEEMARKERQQRLKTTVQGMLKADVMSATQLIEQKAQENKAIARKEELRIKNELQEAVNRGRQRPMLVESYNEKSKNKNLAKVQGLRNYLRVMEESGLSKKDAMDKLNDDEKAAIQEDEFIEAKKKQYGRK